MSSRYGDRGFDRYEDADEERYGGRDYEGRATDYRTGRQRGGPEYGANARGDYDYSRDYGYGRDYSTRSRGERDYEAGGRGPEGILGGYAGAPPARRYEYEDYGRDYERGTSRDYARESAPDYARDYVREPPRDYARESARDYGLESARDYGRDPERVRGYDTDYGRTTSRFYGRSGYEYGREDYDPRAAGRPEYGDYGRRRVGRGRGGREGRGWWDRAADELLSWFGDEDAERRRRLDQLREGRGYGAGKFRGRGPKNYRRSDERISEEIGDRMSDNEWLDASDVDVVVVSGEVTLGGTVDSRYAKRLAEDIAESVSGVTNVQNNLRVRSQEVGAADARLEEARLEEAVAEGRPIPAPGASDVTLTSDVPNAPDAGTTGRASKAAGRS
jgi:osmotically-inducible protein OsmY